MKIAFRHALRQVHEIIRMEGTKELERDVWALLWSAVAAGLSMELR